MSASKLDQPGKKSLKKLLFADADHYTIPPVQGWNEGYSQTNKFLYIQDSNAHATSQIKNSHSDLLQN